MPFWKLTRGTALFVSLVLIGLVVALTVRVHHATTPPRQTGDGLDFQSMMLRVREVQFPSVDGLPLSAWLLGGTPELPPVVLCHDLGSSKAALINLAIALNDEGFSLLLFDFRGHGESGEGRSTLGLKEKRDVLGAVDYLATSGEFPHRQIGVSGVGMGAHAAVLAAADRPSLRVLVLDGLYPDAGFPLVREVYAGWNFGERRFASLPSCIFSLLGGARIADHRASEVLQDLLGRDLLLLAPAGDTRLANAMESMYRAIPEQPDVDGNLVVLPATQSETLYGEDLARHHRRVAEFFLSRLPRI